MGRILTATVVMSLGLSSFAASASAQTGHLDEAAYAVQQKASAVTWEMYRYHRGRPGYNEAYGEARELWAIARDLHELLHHQVVTNRVQRNAHEMDELFHHLQEHIAEWEHAPAEHVHDDHGHSHSHYHVHSLHGLTWKMRSLETAMHHLMEDLGVEGGSPPVTTTTPIDTLPPE